MRAPRNQQTNKQTGQGRVFSKTGFRTRDVSPSQLLSGCKQWFRFMPYEVITYDSTARGMRDTVTGQSDTLHTVTTSGSAYHKWNIPAYGSTNCRKLGFC